MTKVKEGSENSGLKLSIKKLRSWHLVPSFQANRREKVEAVTDFIFSGSKVTADSKVDCSHETKILLLAPWKESYDKLRPYIKKQRHHFADKGQYSQSYAFSNSHAWM